MKDKTFESSLALIGGGYWGKNLARNFHHLGALHTVCDIDDSQLQYFRETYPDIELTSDLSCVFKNPRIKQVVVATWPAAHFSLVRQALLAGKDVFVEKPLCLDVEEADLLLRLAEEKGAILMVGHVLQYHPCVRRLQELVAGGELGKLYYIVSNRLNLGKIRTVENALWSFAPHDISVILSLCSDQLPEQVRCVGGTYLSKGVADTSLTTMRFPGNVRAHIYVSWLNPFKEQKLTVVGSAGIAVFDDTLPWDQKLRLYREPVTWSDGRVPTPNHPEATYLEIPQAEPLREECAHFLHCCMERTAPRTEGAEGLRVLSVLQAAQASLLEEGEAKEARIPAPFGLGQAEFFVHPTAVVDRGAEVGEGCRIWHFSHVMAGAKLGKHCNIGQNVLVSSGVALGANVKVQNNVSLYTGVICEDDVFLGPSAVFTNVINPRSAIVRKDEFKETPVRRGATVGANATIVCGVELGAYSFIGAGAVVTKDVKPYALVMGNPARQVGWMSKHGQRLPLPASLEEGESEQATCPVTGETYQLEGDRLSCLDGEETPSRTEEELEAVLIKR